MAVIVTTMVVADADGIPLDDQCSLCGIMTPWVADFRVYDQLIHACIGCCSNIGKAGKILYDQMAASQA